MRIDAVAGAAAGDPRPAAANVKEAATQFESLLVAQLLKTMRESGGDGWLGTGEDQAGATMMQLAEEHLSQVLAQQGGLGLANLVVEGLDRAAAPQATAAGPE
jgi:Rod binding domain-containing protein